MQTQAVVRARTRWCGGADAGGCGACTDAGSGACAVVHVRTWVVVRARTRVVVRAGQRGADVDDETTNVRMKWMRERKEGST